MPAVLPTERIAHLGTADCCIHPSGRNEMITITPPKIFSKEVAQKQATLLPREHSSPPEIVSEQISGDGVWMNFRFSRVFPPGGLHHPHPRGWRRRLTPALAAALCRSRCTPSRRAF